MTPNDCEVPPVAGEPGCDARDHAVSVAVKRAATVAAGTALALAALLLLIAAAGPMYTEDGWWHIAAGEAFATHGPWLAADPLLFTGREGGPVPHEWLFDVLLWELHQLAGFHGLRVAHALAVLLTLVLVHAAARAWGASPAMACALTALFVLLSAVRIVQLRPDLFSMPATLAGLLLLARLDDVTTPPSWRRVAAWLLLLVVWVNVHSLFLVGINLVFAALLGVLLRMALRRLRPWPGAADEQGADRRLATRLALALLLGVLVTLANPQGVGQHLQFFTASQTSAMWNIVDEWAPFRPFSYADTGDVPVLAWMLADVALLLFAVAAPLAGLAWWRQPSATTLRVLSPPLLGVALAAVVALLVAVRFVWLAWLPALYFARWLALTGVARRPRLASALEWSAAAAALWLALQLLFYPPVETTLARYAEEPAEWLKMPYRSHKYYAEGVYFLQRTGLSGNIFNVYWQGGFLGYWRAPRIRTFIDGRTEHYDTAVADDYGVIAGLGTPPAGGTYLDLLDRHGVDLFFGIGFQGAWHPLFTTPFLEGAPGWILVSRSFRHAIYLRLNERNRANLERVRAFYAAEGVPFDVRTGLDPDTVVRERADFGVRERLLVPEHASLLDVLRAGDGEERLRAGAMLSVNYLLAGAYASAVAVDRRLAADFPGEPGVHWRLVWGLAHLGASDEAVMIAERFVREQSADPVSRRFLALALRYRELTADLTPGVADERWVESRRVLLREFPATYAQTWAIDRVIETEDLPLVRARP